MLPVKWATLQMTSHCQGSGDAIIVLCYDSLVAFVAKRDEVCSANNIMLKSDVVCAMYVTIPVCSVNNVTWLNNARHCL